MTSYVTPKKGFPFICYIGLTSQSTGQFQSNPTLAAGDFKISKDGGALGNLATLPAVTPASSKAVKVSLDSDETNADNLVIIGSDSDNEWDDIFINIQTTVSQIDDMATASALAAVQADTDNIQTRLPAALSGDGYMMTDVRSIDDELTNGNNAILYLKALDVSNPDGRAVNIGATTEGVRIAGSNSVYLAGGIYAEASAGQALTLISDDGGAVGIYASGNGHGIEVRGFGLGKSISAPQNISVSDGDLTLANIASAVWANATRTLTSFGTLIADIWANVTRTITGGTIDTNNDKTGYALTSAYDPAKTASQDSDMLDVLSYVSHLTFDSDDKVFANAAVSLTSDDIQSIVDALSFPTADENAVALLKYDWTSVTGEASRSVLNALRKLRNKVSYSSPTLTITKEDDTATAYTQSVTQDSDQEPFKSVG